MELRRAMALLQKRKSVVLQGHVNTLNRVHLALFNYLD
jgi:hypothetical protein